MGAVGASLLDEGLWKVHDNVKLADAYNNQSITGAAPNCTYKVTSSSLQLETALACEHVRQIDWVDDW